MQLGHTKNVSIAGLRYLVEFTEAILFLNGTEVGYLVDHDRRLIRVSASTSCDRRQLCLQALVHAGETLPVRLMPVVGLVD
jgi:hypothetical protein